MYLLATQSSKEERTSTQRLIIVRRNDGSIYFCRERSDRFDKSKMSNRLKLAQLQFAQSARLARGKRGLALLNGTAMPHAAVHVAELKGKRIEVPRHLQVSNHEISDRMESHRTTPPKFETSSRIDINRQKNRVEELVESYSGQPKNEF